ncbi:hypothetical protein ES288_A12G042800v1 [Gossypium darwinii]|uniref:ATP synthase subunit e, mitochondrial n=1 Tax=Gossypium darwinii TaxID=34276 RepID=A0A5D2E6B5_GOSDA|nr:hypothetical protein ES288_A12G042800v1 [Gossypium darwinii]
MAPPPGPYSGTSTLALVARASAFSFGLVYGSIKLKYLKMNQRELFTYLLYFTPPGKGKVTKESSSKGSPLKQRRFVHS